jgi:hypothetical protein
MSQTTNTDSQLDLASSTLDISSAAPVTSKPLTIQFGELPVIEDVSRQLVKFSWPLNEYREAKLSVLSHGEEYLDCECDSECSSVISHDDVFYKFDKSASKYKRGYKPTKTSRDRHVRSVLLTHMPGFETYSRMQDRRLNRDQGTSTLTLTWPEGSTCQCTDDCVTELTADHATRTIRYAKHTRFRTVITDHYLKVREQCGKPRITENLTSGSTQEEEADDHAG